MVVGIVDFCNLGWLLSFGLVVVIWVGCFHLGRLFSYGSVVVIQTALIFFISDLVTVIYQGGVGYNNRRLPKSRERRNGVLLPYHMSKRLLAMD